MSPAPSQPFRYALEARRRRARGRVLDAARAVHTPAFMAVGTQGAVKAMTPDQVAPPARGDAREHLSPRAASRRGAGREARRPARASCAGTGPILTDSGGFQVFSLPNKEISDHGVRFKSEVDGSVLELTPERSIEIQNALGADVDHGLRRVHAVSRRRGAGRRRRAAHARLARALREGARAPRTRRCSASCRAAPIEHLRARCAEARRGARPAGRRDRRRVGRRGARAAGARHRGHGAAAARGRSPAT